MMFKTAVIFVTTSLAAVANCGLLGQITYADNSIYHQGGYNDATKVSYSSVSQPSVLSNYQQQYQAPVNNYQPAQPYNQYYSAQPAYNLQYSAPVVQPQQYSQYKSQYPAAQFIGPRSFSSAGEVSYSYSTGPGYSTSTGNHQQQQPYQQYAAQQPVSVQPIQQYSQLQRGAPIQHHHHQAAAPQKTIQYFPALPNPATTTNLGTYSPKNAHHYSAFATKSGSAYQTASINHQQPGIVHHSHSPATTLYQTPNAVFRSSFGTGVPTKPSSEIIPPVLRSPSHPTAAIATVAPLGAVPSPRIIQSTPHFTHSVTSTGGYQSRASSSSLAANPIHIPSSPAPVAAAAAAVQQYPQSHHRFSPSTAVSHAKFEGMGVRYEW